MNSKVRKKLFALCAAMMKEQLPLFELYQEKSIYIWPGEMIFRSTRLIEPAAAFIIFSPRSDREEITIEAGWSATGMFPKLIQRPSIIGAPSEKESNATEGVVRIPSVHQLVGLMDNWIPIAAGEEEAVAQRLIKMIVEDGVPYLLEVGRRFQDK